MRLTWRSRSLTLTEPLRISRATMARRDAVQVRLTQDGTSGYGEVVSSVFLRLDLPRIVATLAGLRGRVADCGGPAALLAELPTLAAGAAPGTAGVLAALDSAAHDLAGRLAGVPVHRLVGQPEWVPVPTAYTIGLVPAARAGATARRLSAAGFRCLKVKAGSADPADDLARVAAVRAAAPQATLLLDPNGGWSAETAVRLLDALVPYRVAAVEQPVPPGDVDRLAWVAARTGTPVIADEDAAGLADVHRLAGAVAGVNVKLARCGGLRAALAVIEAAHGHGLGVMLGCLVASSLGIAPAVQLTGYARWVDLDGHLLLADDPWTGLGGADGTLRLSGAPGLGVTPRTTAPGADAAAAPATTPPGGAR